MKQTTSITYELTYKVNELISKVEELEHELAAANKMIRLLTLHLVSEQPEASLDIQEPSSSEKPSSLLET